MVKVSAPLIFAILLIGIVFPSIACARQVAFVAAASDYVGTAAIYDTRNNADAIVATIEPLGFEVTTCYEFTKQEFEDAFRSFCDEAATADVALVYLCGHGGSTRPENYLFPLEVDFPDLRRFSSECIPLSTTLGELARSKNQTDRLDIFIVDGSRENPFLSGAKAFEEGRPNPSAYHSLGFVPRNTIAILPTQPDQLVPEEHAGLLTEALAKVFFASSDYKEGIREMTHFMEEASSGGLSPKIYSAFDGSLSFDEGKIQVSFSEPKQITQFDTGREAAQKLSEAGKIPEAVHALLELYDRYPDNQTAVKEDLVNILTLAPVKDALVGKALIETRLFTFERLASAEEIDGKPGLNLKEAREIIWKNGIWFSRHRDLARRYAGIDAEADDDTAKVFLARIYLKDDSAESDKIAVGLFEEAAANNSIKALNWLGSLYFRGRGVQQSLEKAEEYFQNSADQGSSGGFNGLANVEVDRQKALPENERTYKEALRLYKTAIDMKDFRFASNASEILWRLEGDAEGAAEILDRGAYEAVNRHQMISLIKYVNLIRRTYEKNAFPVFEKILYRYPEEELQQLLLMAADLGHEDAIFNARELDLDFSGAAREICEEKGLSYEFWKFKQDEIYNTLRDN